VVRGAIVKSQSNNHQQKAQLQQQQKTTNTKNKIIIKEAKLTTCLHFAQFIIIRLAQ